MPGALWFRCVLLATVLAGLAACVSTGPGDGPWGGRADTTLSLSVGQEIGPRDSVTLVSLIGVTNDSRCPQNAMCVWAGDAAVVIGVRIGMGPTVPYTLHTGGVPRSVEVSGYRITLVELRPLPLAGVTIPPESYVAELKVELLQP